MIPSVLLRRDNRAAPRRVQDDLGRLFGHWMAPWPYGADVEAEAAIPYPVDIVEDDQKIYVEAEMPGFKATDIEVTLNDGVLNISGERIEEAKEGKQHLYERCHRKIHRSFSLPSPVEEQSVKAQIIDGVLHLELDKTLDGEPTRIEIK